MSESENQLDEARDNETDVDVEALAESEEQIQPEEALETIDQPPQEIDADTLIKILEAVLISSGRPMSVNALAAIFLEEERPDNEQIREALEAIALRCEERGFELKEVASGYRFQVRQNLSHWVARLSEERPQRYTRALLETLGLIAYRQPITRGDIEEIRGVAVSSTIIRTLLDREWIRVVGHRDVPGRPAMFATTRQFLDYFNLKNLQELPPLSEIRDLDQLNPELDLGEDNGGRVLDLPDETETADDEDTEPVDEASLLDEEEAMALAKRPLDDILGYGRKQEDDNE